MNCTHVRRMSQEMVDLDRILKYFLRTESIKSFPLFQADENLADVKVEKNLCRKSMKMNNQNGPTQKDVSSRKPPITVSL